MSTKTQHWAPLSYLSQASKEENIAIIILNRPLAESYNKLKILWKIASVTICVDGGANELYEVTKDHEIDGNNELLPQYITGDFDSIKPNVMDYYKKKGVKIVSTPDQDHTDFTKSITHLVSIGGDKKVSAIIVLGEFSGRLDQTMSNINTCFQAAKITEKPVILLTSDQVAFLLQPGKHSIDVNSGLEGSTCGLIPIGGKCDHVTTTGLKWNITGVPLEFGKLISSSNAFDGSGLVEIETSNFLLWVMAIQSN